MENGVYQPTQLAIVIPAYKAKFLPKTLDSIAAQTDKRFCVYIGDDCSPEDIGSIVEPYKGKFDFVYKRFEANLGGADLVAQWERCISMTQGEKWIWLFSDDDYMDEDCISAFYKTVELEDSHTDLFRFDVKTLNDNTLSEQSSFPERITPEYLLRKKMSGENPCFAVEYIFSREIYYEKNGFQNFDLAWHSDIATWMKFGINGICTIKGPSVIWRNSGTNITGRSDNHLETRKWMATIDFLSWLRNVFFSKSFRWKLYADVCFVRLFRGAVKTLPIDYCVSTSKDYLRGGLRGILLKAMARAYSFV